MGKSRLEAFSDGVLAIILTIMVLELPEPHGDTLEALQALTPKLLNYLLSFLYIGIYWNNHHHLLHTVRKVTGGILWANLHLLFWLSLLPFTTAWMGEHHNSSIPTALYGAMMLASAIAYTILEWRIIRNEGKGSLLARAVGTNIKGYGSIALYVAGIAVAFAAPWLAQCFYALVALVWFIPDRRIERVFANEPDAES
ncbi:putative membrane protein [Rhizomicrobium palustre]|uniref:Putative membrane protein n=1 Tax=Rhizomicrobium palustre TaxID=189966 RepID=A0A846MZD1_9PROT|nr:TMEM175 family protein [Rhizomicrobium palustre]NIK88609.1 putative membrane protein [Rhizomicrobium palustre]